MRNTNLSLTAFILRTGGFHFLLENQPSAKEKLQKQTEILTNTEISGPPCAFLISVDL